MKDKITLIGGLPLEGVIELPGSKNTIPKNMVAAVLTAETCQIDRVSEIEDIQIMSSIIELLGGQVSRQDNSLKISAPKIHLPKARQLAEFSGKSRIPILLCGALLNRLGEAIIPMPGGCQIGDRPVNFHLEALKALGAKVEERSDSYYLTAPEGLRGTRISLPYPSVGATEQVLLSSVLATGNTELKNAAVEPEIIDLVAVLQKMGAIIAVETDRTIRITGVKTLSGFHHSALPDRLEAASWACAAATTNGRITVKGARQLDMITFLNEYRLVGGGFDIKEDGITFYRARPLSSIAIETDVHPGFMTDWQPPFAVLLTQASGASIIHETVYENRFSYVESLNQMGAAIQLYTECLGGVRCRFREQNHRHSAVITGPTPLHGAELTIPDLRAGFSYINAALTAEGQSTINNFSILGRGYEKFEEKLLSLGAQIIS